MWYKLFLFKLAATHVLSIYHTSAVFCMPMLVYLPPNLCFVYWLRCYIRRPSTVHHQKFCNSVICSYCSRSIKFLQKKLFLPMLASSITEEFIKTQGLIRILYALNNCWSLTPTGRAAWSAGLKAQVCPVNVNVLFITNLQVVPVPLFAMQMVSVMFLVSVPLF